MIAASNRAAAGVYEDTTGPLIVAALVEQGFEVTGPVVVPDGEPVGRAIKEAVEGGARAVVTTGGTAEAIRAHGVAQGVPTAALSRGLAGVAGQALVVNLPGSRGGVRDGLAVVVPLLRHAVEQIAGSDH